jgi:hypothetical protein
VDILTHWRINQRLALVGELGEREAKPARRSTAGEHGFPLAEDDLACEPGLVRARNEAQRCAARR